MERLASLWREVTRRTDYERCARPRGDRFDLGLVRRLLDRLGRPQDTVPALHVAGSKGKGSTCHYLERALREAGCTTGLYVSPHLCRWQERIQVDGQPAADPLLANALERVLSASAGGETFFDLMTAAAFTAFQAAGCDVQVVEVGLGGRLDSTNVLRPLASAVTSIEAEHVEVLGPDLASIAAEKAGIFREGARLWSGLLPGHPAAGVLREQARRVKEPLRELPADAAGRPDLPQPQPHMQRNLALARAILEDLAAHPPPGGIPADRFRCAAGALDTLPAAELRIPGRWEETRDAGGRMVVFDIAHTPDSVRATVEAFRRRWPAAHRGVVIGLRGDKDAAAVARAVSPIPAGEEWWAVPAGDHPLSAAPEELAPLFGARPLARPALPPAPEVVLVTGSTYLVGALRLEQAVLAP